MSFSGFSFIAFSWFSDKDRLSQSSLGYPDPVEPSEQEFLNPDFFLLPALFSILLHFKGFQTKVGLQDVHG